MVSFVQFCRKSSNRCAVSRSFGRSVFFSAGAGRAPLSRSNRLAIVVVFFDYRQQALRRAFEDLAGVRIYLTERLVECELLVGTQVDCNCETLARIRRACRSVIGELIKGFGRIYSMTCVFFRIERDSAEDIDGLNDQRLGLFTLISS